MLAKTKASRALLLSAREVPLRLRKVRRCRHLTLHWQPLAQEALLTMPHHVSLAKALAFAESRKAWLEQQIAAHGTHVPFAPGAVIPFLGVPHTIRHVPQLRGVVSAQGGEIMVCGAAEFVARRVRDWLIAQARKEIEPLAAARAAQIGKRIRRLSLRDTGSRWGSCAAGGVLSFSWRLIFAPREVLEYVVCHEVAHLAQMNHSPKFWHIVAELCPHHKSARAWLRRHGQGLYGYG